MLITIGWATTLYALKQRWMRERRAWQWWQQQQTLQSHHSAESIRDGILQQTFAFRRYLESDLATEPQTEQTVRWLDRFQTFYQSLEQLSNQLSPPFAADSLPLALQFLLKDWQKAYPHIALQFALPSEWPYSAAHNQAILSVVTGLLTVVTSKSSFDRDRSDEDSDRQTLQLSLSSEAARHQLTFQLSDDRPETLKAIAASPEIQHLKEIFHSLAAGRLDITYEGTSLIGHLYWLDD